MISKVYVIGDLHLYHENIHKYENRPRGFEEIIRSNWNNIVRSNDVVFVLGDVIFGENKKENLPLYMSGLLGRKILTLGNHDQYSPEFYMENGFDFACHSFVYNDLVFSHAPVTPLPHQSLANHEKEVRFNIHAHFHKTAHRTPKPGEEDLPFKDEFYDYPYFKRNKDRYKLIEIESNLAPVLLEEVLR